jgi:hypothetical protein
MKRLGFYLKLLSSYVEMPAWEETVQVVQSAWAEQMGSPYEAGKDEAADQLYQSFLHHSLTTMETAAAKELEGAPTGLYLYSVVSGLVDILDSALG